MFLENADRKDSSDGHSLPLFFPLLLQNGGKCRWRIPLFPSLARPVHGSRFRLLRPEYFLRPFVRQSVPVPAFRHKGGIIDSRVFRLPRTVRKIHVTYLLCCGGNNRRWQFPSGLYRRKASLFSFGIIVCC